MSREKATISTIEDVTTNLIGAKCNNPVLYLLPVLSDIAISLAVIADEMSKDGEQHE